MKKIPPFSNILKVWYLKNKRDFPWRNTRDPYLIWLSEIIFQQTKIQQGSSYYLKFSEKYPNIKLLAEASEDQILKLWQGLGYYSRARNLHKTAKYVCNELNGVFPDNYYDIIKLKGIGDYTASAIASFCFNEVTAVVDGNVYRFLSRYFGISTPINSSSGKKEFKALAQILINCKDPGLHNQSIMEFGALICTPKIPKCTICPYINSCYAIQNDLISVLPVKENKIKIKKRFFNFLIIHTLSDKTFIKQRTNNDIWKNLFQFPLYESSRELDIKEIINSPTFQKLLNKKSYTIFKFNNEKIIHKLTHQHLDTNFWVIETTEDIKGGILWKDLHNFALPTLIQNFVDNYQKRK